MKHLLNRKMLCALLMLTLSLHVFSFDRRGSVEKKSQWADASPENKFVDRFSNPQGSPAEGGSGIDLDTPDPNQKLGPAGDATWLLFALTMSYGIYTSLRKKERKIARCL
jgi:hypothetical protein